MGETVEQCYARIRAHGLTLKQQSAVDLLVAGNNDTKTAELLGVARTTVSKWRCYDPAFQAALQARRADVWGSGLDQLRALIPKALARIAQELDSKLYSYEAAIALMRLIKIPSLAPTGPSSAEQVIEDLTTERMMARRHACMEDLGEMTGMKDKFPAPELERGHTREDVLGVLAHRLNDVIPSKSDPWETRQEYAKALFSQAPGGGNTSEQSATPVPAEALQPAAESPTPPAATAEAASAAPTSSIMPAETQRLAEIGPDPLSPPKVLHNQGDQAPFKIASQPAATNVEVPAEPPQPADQAAWTADERATTPPLAAPATPEVEKNETERLATPVPSLPASSEPERTAPECSPAAGPAGPADPPAGNETRHTTTPAPAGPAAAPAGPAAAPAGPAAAPAGPAAAPAGGTASPPDPEDAWVREEIRSLRAILDERKAKVDAMDLEITRTAEALSGQSILPQPE